MEVSKGIWKNFNSALAQKVNRGEMESISRVLFKKKIKCFIPAHRELHFYYEHNFKNSFCKRCHPLRQIEIFY